jgi:hypothetical protein
LWWHVPVDSVPNYYLLTVAMPESINLDENDFRGPIPTELGNLKQLEFLSMQTNGFDGLIPSEIGLLTALSECKELQGHLLEEYGRFFVSNLVLAPH